MSVSLIDVVRAPLPRRAERRAAPVGASRRMGPRSVARAAYGALLLLAPSTVPAIVTARPPDRWARVYARVLGGRHLAQQLVLERAPGRGLVIAIGIDAVHGACALGLASRHPSRARLLHANAATSATFVLADAVAWWRRHARHSAGRS